MPCSCEEQYRAGVGCWRSSSGEQGFALSEQYRSQAGARSVAWIEQRNFLREKSGFPQMWTLFLAAT